MAAPPSGHDVFDAVAHPTRRRLLKLLADREMPIVAIVEHFSVSRTAINKHLQVLDDAGLVSSRKVGRETRYQLTAQPLWELKDWLSFFERYWDERLSALKENVEEDGSEQEDG